MNSDVPDFVPPTWVLAFAVRKLTEDLRVAFNPDIDLGKLRDDLRRLDGDGDA